MPTYLVRFRPHEEPAPKPLLFRDIPDDSDDYPPSEDEGTTFLGVFVASNLTDLFWIVDEQLDPGECEYATLRACEGLRLTADAGWDVQHHYSESLSIREMEGKLKWKRIPYWTKGS